MELDYNKLRKSITDSLIWLGIIISCLWSFILLVDWIEFSWYDWVGAWSFLVIFSVFLFNDNKKE